MEDQHEKLAFTGCADDRLRIRDLQGTAVPPVGCESKIDGLRNEVGALEKESNQVPYSQKFILTPAQQDPSNSLSVEWGLPNYLDVPLAHLTVDHKVTAVLLPGATAAPSGETTQAPYQVTFRPTVGTLAMYPPKWRCRLAFCGRLRRGATFSV